MKIGVFDSGIGGEAVAAKLKQLLPDSNIKFVNDHDHMPYGNRTKKDIIKLTNLAIQPLLKDECEAIVIACNTATTVALPRLRLIYPDINFIGIEPMVKPAARITKSKHIAICATPRTLSSLRYGELKKQWLNDIEIIEPDCSDWAELIEKGRSNLIDVEELVKYLKRSSTDVIVLGCTHYHWLKDRFEIASGPQITILEPSDAIAERIKNILN